MKLCLISCQYPPLSRTYRRYQFARLLAEGGCDVTVVAHGNVSTALGTFVEDPGTLPAQAPPVLRPQAVPWYLAGEVLARAGLIACPYINWVGPAVRAALQVVRGPQDVVCGIYPPASNHIVALRVAERTGARLVLDFRDEYLGLARGLRRRLARRWQARLLARADLVSVATAAVGEGFVAAGLDPARVHLTQNGFWEAPPILPAYEPRPQPRIVYVGAMSPAQGVDVLVRAVARLHRDSPAFVGSLAVDLHGPDTPHRRRTLSRSLPAGVRYAGYLPAARVTQVLLDADVAFLSLASERYAYAVPGKLYDYIAHARPILASLPAGEAQRLIDSDGIGLVAPCGSEAALAAHLARICAPEERRRLHERAMAVRPRHAARPHFLSLSKRIQAL